MLYKDFFPDRDLHFTYQPVELAIVEGLKTEFPIDKLGIYSIERNQKIAFQLTVAGYRDQQNQPRQAIVFPKTKVTPVVLDMESLRGRVWNSATNKLKNHSDDNALFLTWWDNAQRLHLMTGRESWVSSPLAQGFLKQDEQKVWQAVSGGYTQKSKRLKQMADWLTMDADTALEQIKKTLPADQQIYFLVTVEDLARINEIVTLSGRKMAFETKVFATTDNMHTLITQVKSWAKQGSTGSYMVQNIPGVGVRTWRIKDSQTENSLLARILPFSHALEKPLKSIDLVYRSEYGGYLTIYRLNSK